jgi:hypothetical protein
MTKRTDEERLHDIQQKKAKLAEQEKKIKARLSEKERKARTKRLIELGARMEKICGGENIDIDTLFHFAELGELLEQRYGNIDKDDLALFLEDTENSTKVQKRYKNFFNDHTENSYGNYDQIPTDYL